MRIELAYDQKVNGRERKADSTVEVDSNTGRALINSGMARLAGEPAKEEPAATNSKEKKEVDSE